MGGGDCRDFGEKVRVGAEPQQNLGYAIIPRAEWFTLAQLGHKS